MRYKRKICRKGITPKRIQKCSIDKIDDELLDKLLRRLGATIGRKMEDVLLKYFDRKRWS